MDQELSICLEQTGSYMNHSDDTTDYDSAGPLPIVDRNSDLERLSFDALKASLPMERFLVRDVRTEDHGVDLQIETRIANRATNLKSEVQLKAKESLHSNIDGSVSLVVDASNLNYVTNGPGASCAMYILYIHSTSELRYVWAAEERARIEATNPGWWQQKSVSLRFGPQSLRETKAIEEVYHRISADADTDGSISDSKSTTVDDYHQDKGIDGDPDRLVETQTRIKQVREDLKLDLSRFAKALSYPDQRKLRLVEMGEEQAPIWLVNRVADLSGVRADWIEIGHTYRYDGTRYKVRHISLHCAPEDLIDIFSLKPNYLYLCLEPRSRQVAVVVQLSEHNWRTYNLCHLDFWIWGGSRYYIPKVRAFLQGVLDVESSLVNYSCCYLSPRQMRHILSGNAHPRSTVLSATRRIDDDPKQYWAEDLVDIFGERDSVKDTEEDYERQYGRWFVRAREMMREWDGAVHPFEKARRLRERDAEDSGDGATNPKMDENESAVTTSIQRNLTHSVNATSVPLNEYGGPINLLPRSSRQAWWRRSFSRR